MPPKDFDPSKKRKSPPRKDPTFRRLDAMIPRGELDQLLSTSDDPRYLKLQALLLDPVNRTSTLATIARKADVSYPDLVRFITSARLGDGVLRMSQHVPEVLEDIAIDAKSKLVACPECKGTGEVERTIGTGKNASTELIQCWSCDGKGKLRKPGDSDARSFVGETFGIIGRNKGGVTVNVNQAATGIPSVEDEMDRTSKILDMPMLPATTEGNG